MRRLTTLLVALFALLALMLTVVGVQGILTFMWNNKVMTSAFAAPLVHPMDVCCD